MLTTLLFGLITTASAGWDLFNADDQRAELIGFNSDETKYALRLYDVRSPDYQNAHPNMPVDCPGYTQGGAPFNGGANVVFYTNGQSGAKFPLMDAMRCTPPDDIEMRTETIQQTLDGEGIKPGGEVMDLEQSGSGKQQFDFDNERFRFSNEVVVPEDEAAATPGSHTVRLKIRTRYDTLEFDHVIQSATEPTLGVEKVIVTPTKEKILVIGWVQTDKHRAVGPMAMMEKREGRWQEYPPRDE